MLRELSIRQFAIIEEIQLRFEGGFHVLTGETGAGKSILIDALGLIAGGRASSEFVRHGADKAEIEALFDLSHTHPIRPVLAEWGVEDDQGSLIIRREITAGGKSTCRVNGRIVTLAMLKQIGKKLIDISGQHEHQSLLQVEEHLEWLDRFGGEEILSLREEYEQVFGKYQQLHKELRRINLNQKEMAQRIDLLQFQKEEIESAQLVAGEDEELEQEKNRLVFAEKLITHTAKAYDHLYGDRGGLDHIQEALSHLEEIIAVDETLAAAKEMVQTATYQVEEAVRELGRYQDDLEFDPDRLYEVEERLHLLKQLKRKYGDSIEDILQYGEKVEQELEQLVHRDETQAELEERIRSLSKQLGALAEKLTACRKKAASLLEEKVERELRDLNMGSTIFHVAFYPDAYRSGQFLPTGKDVIEFQIAPNPGEPLRPLAKIASGGELSRMMLALKCIFTDIEDVHTLIFDEIDTGVSGRAAQAIAEKIAVLAQKNQVLCVTHLPQVACMADLHFYISKESQNDKTRTKVESLNHQGRTLELARMLGGVEVTQKTCEHAEEMLRLADRVKQTLH
ncbi:DNA repair protein RecN [Paenactinomyces guangxiensis]|uniref:DNA repair protein RecN n=1 Tax=Paenactinomyces guangxiensis TaxID=1490290 RepID=A0A7W1WS22_9BACL|nr:DNA repair protein RecN [Paenactinomyces guangxiensis]MBA4495008.1 DNA repair protein RecN [Paenactinomyces guangxiensis]MBH8592091.1 DNA repair protein RecN [Paenactinomyces guangxiensis]